MQLLALALTAAAVSAAEFRFTNRCSYNINLRGPGGAFICDIAPGKTRGNNCGATVRPGVASLFKHTASDQANLLEFAVSDRVWYDVSNIPPGPGHCTSYADCKKFTGGKTGYNVPVDVVPTRRANGRNCRKLHVTRPDSPDAYLFPNDYSKMADCPLDEVFNVVYCPGNRLRA